MIYLLFILSAISCFSQTETLVTSIVSGAISGQTEYYRMKDRAGDLSYNKKWHNLEFADVSAKVGVGISIALTSDDLYDGIKQGFLFGAVRWVVMDGVYNLNQGNGFFYRSPNTTNILEPLGLWYIKLPILAIIIIWNYLY